MTQEPIQLSAWQKQIQGVWHGLPSMFNAAGEHIGYLRGYRTCKLAEDGRPYFHVREELKFGGPLRTRIQPPDVELFVDEAGLSRVYDCPYFVGSGNPYGTFLLGNDYIVPWRLNTHVTVQLLPGGTVQAYSIQLYQEPVMQGVLIGQYKVAYDEAPATMAAIDAFIDSERQNGPMPFALGPDATGAWHGTGELYGGDQQFLGETTITIERQAVDFHTEALTVTFAGAHEEQLRYQRHWQAHNCFIAGESCTGNGMAFGRALLATSHVRGQARRIVSREIRLGPDNTLTFAWQFFANGRLDKVIHAVLPWEAR